MLNERGKPIYYDGSGTISIRKTSEPDLEATKLVNHDVPPITNPDQKPPYYDGSGNLQMKPAKSRR